MVPMRPRKITDNPAKSAEKGTPVVMVVPLGPIAAATSPRGWNIAAMPRPNKSPANWRLSDRKRWPPTCSMMDCSFDMVKSMAVKLKDSKDPKFYDSNLFLTPEDSRAIRDNFSTGCLGVFQQCRLWGHCSPFITNLSECDLSMSRE